jgi:hypothetical protein
MGAGERSGTEPPHRGALTHALVLGVLAELHRKSIAYLYARVDYDRIS